MSDFMWTAITMVAYGIGFGIIAVLLLFFLFLLIVAPGFWPRIKQRLLVRWSRMIEPYTLWKVKRKPSLEVTATAWDRIFLFQKKTITIGSKAVPMGHVGTIRLGQMHGKYSYSFVAFESGMKPEVREWCAANLEDQPIIQPPYVTSSINRVRMFLIFASDDDAFAFKMRWC
jgi:hypothetical protein